MPQNVNRIQDAAVANVNEIAPKNWHRYPPRVGSMTPEYVRVLAYSGGVQGDDVDTATATLKYEPALGEASSYTPRTQTEKACGDGPCGIAGRGHHPAARLGRARRSLFGKAGRGRQSDHHLAGTEHRRGRVPSPLAVVVTGTNFTPWSTLETGDVASPYASYESPTKMTILMDPKRVQRRHRRRQGGRSRRQISGHELHLHMRRAAMAWEMRTSAEANSSDPYRPKTIPEKAGARGGPNAAVSTDPNFTFAITAEGPAVECNATLTVPNQ